MHSLHIRALQVSSAQEPETRSWFRERRTAPPTHKPDLLPSPTAWRQRWRYLRAQRWLGRLPAVDWRRYHLQVLFVDHGDTLRAPLAAGLFERIANWNGAGRILLPFTRGVGVPSPQGDGEGDPRGAGAPADAGADARLSTTAALFSEASRLRIRPKLFSKPREAFEARDFDLYDLLIAVDGPTLEAMLGAVDPRHRPQYARQAGLLTAFLPYCGIGLLASGGSAVLDPDLRSLVAPEAPRLREVQGGDPLGGIPAVSLAGDPAAWRAVVAATITACAGVVQFVLDAYPPDLPEYDPV